MTPKTDSVAVLREAAELIRAARWALGRLGLRGKGSDLSLSHEVRMFALDFSPEHRDGPGALQVNGTGRADQWLKDASAAIAALSTRGEAVQGSPQWYVEELRTLADNITGRGVGICNGAALTIERLSAPGGVGDAVTEEMVAAALDAQPFKDANSGTRVWQLIASDGEGTETVMRAALIAALAARTGKGEG